MLLIIPLVTAIGTWLIPKQKLAEYLHLFSAFILLLSGTIVLLNVVLTEPILMFRDYIYIDSLSALLIFVLVLVVLVASIYSVGYFRFELKEGLITLKQFHQFYLWFHLFIFTMISVMMLNNIALIWIAIELTTLVFSLLISFYRKRESLEAAWKYLIIGSLGIAFALFGILFLYAAGIDVLGNTYEVLNWTVLFEIAQQLDPVWVTVAFIFILVGYGTKAGLAPL